MKIMEIDFSRTLSECDANIRIFVPDDADKSEAADLAAHAAMENRAISVAPDCVNDVWGWLEGKNIPIYARFEISSDKDIAEISAKITRCFKHGATGIQLFMPFDSAKEIIEAFQNIRGDLFFGRNISIGFDISQISPVVWPSVFEYARMMQADGMVLLQHGDGVAGQAFAMLSSFDSTFSGTLQFLGLNAKDVEDVFRLTQKIRPEIVNKLEFYGVKA